MFHERNGHGHRHQGQYKTDQGSIMDLDTGLWICSNGMTGAGNPIYATQVARPEHREAQWLAIRNAEADRRGFWIFRKKSQLLEWIDEYKQDTPSVVDIEALLGQGSN